MGNYKLAKGKKQSTNFICGLYLKKKSLSVVGEYAQRQKTHEILKYFGYFLDQM